MTRGAPVRVVRGLTAGCLTLAGVLCDVAGWGRPAWWAVPLLAAGVAAAELAVVHASYGRQRWTVSLTESALAVALVLAPGAWTVLGMGVGVLLAQAARRQPALKLQFNVAQFVLATSAATLVARSVPGVAGPVAGLAAFWLVNYVLVAVVVARTSDRSLRQVVVSTALLSAVHTAGNSSIGLLAGHLVLSSPVALLGLAVPLVLLFVSYDQQANRTAEARLFAELARGRATVGQGTTDASAEVVLTAAARLLGGADVEMVLLAPDGPVRFVGDERGLRQRQRVDASAFDEPWVLRALGVRGIGTGIGTGVEAGRAWCTAVLGDPEAPRAVLRARRPAGAATFGRDEVRLVQVLAGQAETWLSVADLSARHRAAADQAVAVEGAARALGDLGAETAPALAVLRESTERLARMSRADQAVGDVVEELRLVERAVASLLGAVALAAEPDLLPADTGRHRVPSGPVRRPAQDWTTTGTFR